MAVSSGTSILASEYNSFRSTLSAIYFTQYGQTMRSTTVSSGVNRVTSAQMLQLYLDAQSVHVHQRGLASVLIAVPPTGQTVGANTSQTYNQTTGAKATPVDGTEQSLNDYELVIIDVSNFDGSTTGWPDSSFSLGTNVAGTRATNWGTGTATEPTSIYHVVTFTFASLAARDAYFAAGGELRFSAALTGGTGSKDADWAAMLSSMGTIKLDKYRLTADSGTPAVNSGYDDLTGTYQEFLSKTGSGVYSANEYTIEGRIVSDTVLRFRITFGDLDTGTLVDEEVSGTTTSNVNTFRPDSSFVYDTVTYTAVDIAAPTIATVVNLSANNASPPA
jgi:hypothetical protein